MKVLGLMSGTSMEGLDCCYADIELNSRDILKFQIIKCKTIPFQNSIKQLIAQENSRKAFYSNFK